MDVRTQRRIDSWVGRAAIGGLRPLAKGLGWLLRRDHSLEPREEVAFMKLLGGGSLLIAMPMLLGFRRAYPKVKMVLITTPAVKPFAELMGPGVFDEYRVIDNRTPLALLASSVRALRRTMSADCIVDLEVHSRLTTVFATLTMARNRVGFWLENIFWRRSLASHLIFFNRSSPNFAFYDRVADLFGFPTASREDCFGAVVAGCGLQQPLSRAGRVCVGFSCSELSRERMLTPEQWVRVFQDHVRDEHREFYLLGTRADRPLADKIIGAIAGAFPRLTLSNRCGELSLKASASFLFQSTEFWGIDSSLLHLARLAGLRCLSFWGPTDPAMLLRTSWRVEETVVYRKLACSPCVHTSEDPPCRGDNRCIQGLFDPARAPLGWTPIEYPGRA